MHKITNNTNSPHVLESANGAVIIPAFGTIEGEFSGDYLALLQSCGAVTIEPINDKPKRGRQRKENGNDIH